MSGRPHGLPEPGLERCALALAASEDGFWDWIVASDDFYASPRLLEIYGFAAGTTFAGREDFLARFPFHPEDRERWQRAAEAHFADRNTRFDLEIRLIRHGETRWIHLTGLATRDDAGAVTRWTGAARDVTQRRLAEDALRRSEERLALALEAIGVGYWDWIADGDQFYASPRMLEMSGMPPDTTFASRREFLERYPVHPQDRPHWEQARAAHLASTERYFQMEFRLVPRGKTRWMRMIGVAVRDPSGALTRWVGSITDITERKQAQAALMLSEERYARAMEGSDAGHWDWNIVTDEMFVSARAREMLALPPGPLPALRAEIMALVPQHPDDAKAMLRKVNANIASGLHEREYRVLHGPGQLRWLRSRGKVYKDARGAAVRMTGSLTDITQEKLALDALRASEERYSQAMEASKEGHFDWDVVTDDIFVSMHLRRVLGLPADAVYQTRQALMSQVAYHPDDVNWLSDMTREVLAGASLRHEFEYRTLRGCEVRWLRTRWKIFRDAAGMALRVIGVITDETARKLDAQALHKSEERYALALEASTEGHFDTNSETGELFVSERLVEIFGMPKHPQTTTLRAFLGDLPFCEDEDRQRYRRAVAEAEAAGGPDRYEVEYRISPRPGEVRWLSSRGQVIRGPDGRARRRVGVVVDITERKLAADALRESEARFRALTALSSDWYWRQDENLRFTYLSTDLHQLDGYPGGSALGKTRWELPDLVPLSGTWDQHRATVEAHQPFREFIYSRPAGDGSVRYISISGAPMFDDDGRFRGYQGTGRNVTDERRAAEALRASEARFRALTELSSDWYWAQDEQLRFRYMSDHATALGGYAEDASLGHRRWDLQGLTPMSGSWADHQAVLAAREPFRDMELRRVMPDGSINYLSISGVPTFDRDGRFTGYQGVGRNTSERRRLEGKLRQAQRLEAMGTLAGGIAHDFNNILGVILGYGEMALRDSAKGSRLRRDVGSIITAGERGRALVDRVLTFSRSDMAERNAVHVQKVTQEVLDLLSAKLPRGIKLRSTLRAGAAAMLGDATQVHQVVMNLVTNAIQAMPRGGDLHVSLDVQRVDAPPAPTIGTLQKGDYIVLRVADTGTGIAPDIIERIFDPFFTTKDVRTGTGLGLSLVHGIVTEVGGAIDVASTPGAGSAFTVYLPRTGDAERGADREEGPIPRGGGQRVLIVDDEEPLVKLASRALKRLGYAPVGFTSSTAALAAFRADPTRFDAVVTDERMPGMSGSALIRKMRGIRDGIPIILMSGYLGTAVAERARDAGAEEVLKKPLSSRDLAASLARVLGS